MLYIFTVWAIHRKLRFATYAGWRTMYRQLKTLLFGIVDGTNNRGRPYREWMDDIVSWSKFKTGLQELNSSAHERRRWKLITRQAVDTNGRWSHGSWRRRRRTYRWQLGTESPLIEEAVIDVPIRLLARRRCTRPIILWVNAHIILFSMYIFIY